MSIKLLAKFVIIPDFERELSLYEMSCILPNSAIEKITDIFTDFFWISYGFYGCQLSKLNSSHQTSQISHAEFYIG